MERSRSRLTLLPQAIKRSGGAQHSGQAKQPGGMFVLINNTGGIVDQASKLSQFSNAR